MISDYYKIVPVGHIRRRHFIFFTLQDTSILFSIYLVKGRYCACAIAINLIAAACKNWDGQG